MSEGRDEAMAGRTGPTDGHLDEERIFGLAEGGLEASERAAAEAHLRGCAACRREVETAAGYFRETAGLEPVKAPADFLANVRARLPRPSPLRIFLEGFMRPWRAVPMQVALPAILGLTVISSYLYQRGGLRKDAAEVISETAAQPPAEAAAETADETTGGRPEPMAERPATASKNVESEGYASPHPRGAETSSSRKSSPALPSLRKQAQSDQTLSDQTLSDRALSKKDDAPASGSRSDGSMGESEAAMELDRAPPPAPRMEQVPTPEAARAEKSRPAQDAEAARAIKEKKAEAKGRFGDKAISGSKPMQEAPASLNLGNAEAIGSAEPPAFILRLAPGKRIGDVVSGLRAMGADSLSAGSVRTTGDSGGKGIDYVLQVPASMRKDIAPYLERYGKTESAGPLPAGSASFRIRIRFLP